MRFWSKTSLALAVVVTIVLAGCSASKSSGSTSDPTAPSVAQTARLRASDVLSGAVVAGASVSGGGLTGGTTDSAGAVTLTTTEAATYGIDVAASGYVTRNTLLKLPGNDALVSLVAASFDLAAFDEMFRADEQGRPAGLQRWVTAPALRIISNVLDYTDNGSTHVAIDEALTPEEIQAIVADLSYGLPLLTGGTFAAFASVSTRTVPAGEAVTILADGSVTFARCRGVTTLRGAAGVGQWQYRSDDVVTGGSVCIDRDFELGTSSFKRGVRLHEMGHALGYKHVNAKANVLMQPTISVNDVTQWDRDATTIAFRRPAGNKAPDRDPATFTTNRLVTRVMTSDGCRVRR